MPYGLENITHMYDILMKKGRLYQDYGRVFVGKDILLGEELVHQRA